MVINPNHVLIFSMTMHFVGLVVLTFVIMNYADKCRTCKAYHLKHQEKENEKHGCKKTEMEGQDNGTENS